MVESRTPYGTWPSPISAEVVAQAGIRVSFPTFVEDEIWWLEGRPSERGRSVVVAAGCGRHDPRRPAVGLERADPRVHEYGGLCYLGYDAGGPNARD